MTMHFCITFTSPKRLRKTCSLNWWISILTLPYLYLAIYISSLKSKELHWLSLNLGRWRELCHVLVSRKVPNVGIQELSKSKKIFLDLVMLKNKYVILKLKNCALIYMLDPAISFHSCSISIRALLFSLPKYRYSNIFGKY